MKKLYFLLFILSGFVLPLNAQTNTDCNLKASFSFERDPSHPNKIKFTNSSSPASDIHSVKWNFGDGTYSTDLNPIHTYSRAGLYNVCLIIIKNDNCKRDVCMQVQVEVPTIACNLIANFGWSTNTTTFNKIHFTNLSSSFAHTDQIKWSFGDGTSSTEVNPTHIYAAPGTYNVCIRVQKNNSAGTAACVKEICKQVVVKNECRIEANFSFAAELTNKNKINFKNLSTLTSVSHVQWSFGDGTISNLINPSHIYTKPGKYNVCLRISNTNTCTRQICKTVEIKETEIHCTDISKFAFSKTTDNCLKYKFTPAIQNANWKYVWAFGDGTGSTEVAPTHVYQRPGNYTVVLTVYKSATCSSSFHKLVETGDCNNCNNSWAKFEYKRDASGKIYFHALSNHQIKSQTWTFTKLTIAGSQTVTLNQNNPVYLFNEPGDYRVCLRAVIEGGCVKEYCQVIHIGAFNYDCNIKAYPNPASNHVNVAVHLAQPSVINVYIFNSTNVLVKRKDQQGNTGDNIVTTNIEGLVAGMYTLKVVYGNRVCYSKFQKL